MPAKTPASARPQQLAKTRARRAERAERRENMLDDAVSGVDRRVIATNYRVSLKTVYRKLNHALDQRRLDAPDRYVRLQVERLTRAVQAIDRVILDGEIEAVTHLLKVIDKLDRYHGLGFAPVSFAAPPRPPTPAPLALTRERTQNGA